MQLGSWELSSWTIGNLAAGQLGNVYKLPTGRLDHLKSDIRAWLKDDLEVRQLGSKMAE